MNCENVQLLLQAYLDGELDEDEQEFVETHTADCADCSELLAEVKQLSDRTTRAFEGHEPFEAFTRRVMAEVVRETKARSSDKPYRKIFTHLARPLPAAAAILVVLASAFLVLFGSGSQKTQPISIAVADVTGVVLVRGTEDTPWHLADTSWKAQGSAIVVTGPRAQARIQTPSLTLHLQRSAAMSVGTNTELLRGTTRIDIASSDSAQRIVLPDAVLMSESGQFLVTVPEPWTGEPVVILVLEGRGVLRTQGGEQTIARGKKAIHYRAKPDTKLFVVTVPNSELAAAGRNMAAISKPARRVTPMALDRDRDPIEQLHEHLRDRTRDAADAATLLAVIPGVEPTESVEALYADVQADPEARLAAGRILAGTIRDTFVTRLFATLQDEEAPGALRIQAAQALGTLETPALIGSFPEGPDSLGKQPGLWAQVARARYQLGDHALARRILSDLKGSDDAKSGAIEAAGAIRRSDFYMPLAAIAVAEKDSYGLRLAAVKAAARIDPAKTRSWLQGRIETPESEAQIEGLTFLAAIDPPLAAHYANRVLTDHTGPPAIRTWAARAASTLPAPFGPDLLAIALKDPEMIVRLTAAETLCRRGHAEAVTTAVEALKDSNWYVQARAARVLANYGNSSHIFYLEEMRNETDNWFARNAATEAQQILEAGRATVAIEELLSGVEQRAEVSSYRFAKLTLDGLSPLVRSVVEQTERHRNASRETLVEYTNEFGILRLMQLSVRGLDPETRKGAIEALQKLTGMNFGFDYTTPIIEEREAAMERWEQWWLTNRELYQSQETQK